MRTRSSRFVAAGVALALAVLAAAPQRARAQERSIVSLHELVRGLTVTSRVLLMGAHPDDDDPWLMAWLARGRQVETGYLSLTRGESGENFLGNGGGVSLGALRTGEVLAARRIDGGRAFFTRAYDFGYARTAVEAFKRWDHDSLLTDVITIVRSFRPQVMVAAFGDDVSDGNGQHAVLGLIAREAFDAAGDTTRCSASKCGAPWTPRKLYQHGDGLAIDAGEYDRFLRRTYADIAVESRAQHRSQGLINLPNPADPATSIVRLRRADLPDGDATTAAAESSLFDGIDTSFARLGAGAASEVRPMLASFVAIADSVRAALDLARPSAVVEQLARAVRLADAVRASATWCHHPSVDAAPPAAAFASPTTGAAPSLTCNQAALELDGAIDLVRRRAHDALLAAAGVTIAVTANREIVAESDTVSVVVAVANHGSAPITLGEVSASGTSAPDTTVRVIAPNGGVQLLRHTAALGLAQPWWVGPRKLDAFPSQRTALDGFERPRDAAPIVTTPGIAVPEEIRRTSEVDVTLTIAGVTFSTRVGPILHRSASATLGVQERPVGAAPAVTLSFERGLEWLRADRPLDRELRLVLRSYSDARQTIALGVALAPKAIRIDSLPSRITLGPREQRNVFLRLRGTLTPGRYEFAIVGRSESGNVPGGQTFFEGFQTKEYAHVAPVRMYRSSGLYLQALNVEVPSKLVVASVQGVGDGGEAALRQLGIPSRVLSPEELSQVDLTTFTTVVVGPRAYEAHPELVGQSSRLRDFARNGGTLVVLNGQHASRSPTLLPYPATVSQPLPEHVIAPNAAVTVVAPASRLLTWPNRIVADDWTNWVRERALFVPTTVSPRYAQVVEMHDDGQPENRNAILMTPLGKGMYVYSALTFFEQLPAGVPGSLRLLINLLSVGCKPAGATPATC